jgi:acetyl esterase/lipase
MLTFFDNWPKRARSKSLAAVSAGTFLGAFLFGLPFKSLASEETTGSQSIFRPADAERIADLSYASESERQKLDLYLPRNKELPLPLVIWIHGGGFTQGDKTMFVPTFLTNYGYAVASINYRFSTDAPFPAQLLDCKSALQFLRENALKFRLDSSRIAIFGGSAGGTLAALLGTASADETIKSGYEQVRAVVDWSGISDVEKYYDQDPRRRILIEKLLNGKPRKNKDLAKMASAVNFARKELPPFLIMHGDQDEVVPVSQSEELYAALRKAGANAQLYIVHGADHGLINEQNVKMVIDFLDHHLKKKVALGSRSHQLHFQAVCAYNSSSS